MMTTDTARTGGRTGTARMALPTKDLAIAYPLPIADTVYWQFYRTCGFENNLIVSHFSVESFSRDDAERAVTTIEAAVTRMARRGADSYRITGVPVLSALGRERALEVAHSTGEAIGAPVGLDFEDSIAALHALGGKNIVLTAKWEAELLAKAVGYLADAGVDAVGVVGKRTDFNPDNLWRITTQEGLELALQLGRDALIKEPDADILFLGGGSWLSVAAVPILEQELGIPVVTNLNATYWQFMHDVGSTPPVDDTGRLFQVAPRTSAGTPTDPLTK